MFDPEFWRDWADQNQLPLRPHSEEDVSAAEQRLAGIPLPLPPSYRNFLLTIGTLPDGVAPHFEVTRLFAPSELAFFRDAHDHWVTCYEDPMNGRDESDGGWKVSHLRGTVQVSDASDSVFLLNPAVVDPVTGEWEAWHWANWVPGANVYTSFGELLVSSYAEKLRFEGAQ